MTEKSETQHKTLIIPSREEFHRYASNLITNGDFDTDHSSGYQIGRVASALNWTYMNDRRKKCNYNR